MTSIDDPLDAPMADINMTPLVDVMLVLLILFIVTIPVIRHGVRVELPQASSARDTPAPTAIHLAVDARGQTWWNGDAVDDAQLEARLIAAAAMRPQPELRLQGDRAVRYERVAQVMSAVRRAGLQRLGFVTAPGT